MSFELHIKALNKMCRVCGHRLTKSGQKPRDKYKPVNKETVGKELGGIWGICVWQDEVDVHPQHICHKCARRVRHHQLDESKGGRVYKKTRQDPDVNWKKHSRLGFCQTCTMFTKQSKAGRHKPSDKYKPVPPSKRERPEPLPFSLTDADIFAHCQHTEHASTPVNLDIINKSPHEAALFSCVICMCILSNPVTTPCGENYCSGCLSRFFQFHKSPEVQCPVCSEQFHFHQVTASPKILTTQLSIIDVACTTCGTIGHIEPMKSHKCPPKVKQKTIACPCDACTAKQQQHHPPNQSTAKSTTSPLEEATSILAAAAANHDKDQPIPPAIERMTDKWTWLKINMAKSRTVFLRTGGMPAKVQQITHRRKSSRDVTRAYSIRRRNDVLSQLDDDEREELQRPVQQRMDVETAIAFMRHLRLTWDQLRKVRRYFRQIDVIIASEKKMRAKRDEILQDHLGAEMVPLTFNSTKAGGSQGKTIKDTPYVFVKDLGKYICDLLDKHDQFGNLTWHQNMIPEDEIWIKVGGDKGGSSFKMFFQIANLAHPNSLDNTMIFACFEACDTTPNLQETLARFQSQIDSLKHTKWRGKTFKLLFFGDCELIGRMYGILSCNAVYACPVCEGKSADWQAAKEVRGPFKLRTLDSIQECYAQYERDGKRKERSKLVSKSVVNKPIFPIEPSEIVMPTLHMSLGIYKRLYDQLEDNCQDVDNQIFQFRIESQESQESDSGSAHSPTQTNFQEAISVQVNRRAELTQSIKDKEEELEDLEDELPLIELPLFLLDQADSISEDVKALYQRSHEIRKQIDEMKAEINQAPQLPSGAGPCTSALDDVLQSHRVKRQAYHGKSFVGNHVKKCCKSDVIDDLVESAKSVVEDQPDADDFPLTITKMVQDTKSDFTDILLKFSNVHRGINQSTTNLSDDELEQIDTDIKEFMKAYRTIFPKSSIPLKMHLLEDHTIDQIRRFRAGLGLLNEQGGELSHRDQNNEEKVHCCILDPLKKLLAMVQAQHTTCSPEIQSKILKPKARKQNEE